MPIEHKYVLLMIKIEGPFIVKSKVLGAYESEEKCAERLLEEINKKVLKKMQDIYNEIKELENSGYTPFEILTKLTEFAENNNDTIIGICFDTKYLLEIVRKKREIITMDLKGYFYPPNIVSNWNIGYAIALLLPDGEYLFLIVDVSLIT